MLLMMGFLRRNDFAAWDKIGAAPVTRKCLDSQKFDDDDKTNVMAKMMAIANELN